MENQQDPYNRGGFLAFLFSVAFCLVFFVYISFIHPGVDLKEVKEVQPGAEQTLAGGGAAKAVDISGIEKPWEPNEDMVAHGAKVYKTNCAMCHGDTGLGDGPAGKASVPPARNLVEGNWKVGGTSIALYGTIQNGITGTSMAAWKHIPVKDRWAMVQFIRSITENKIPDDANKLAEFAKTAE